MMTMFEKWLPRLPCTSSQMKDLIDKLRRRKGNGAPITKDAIMRDAKILTSDYVEDRLIRSGLSLKKRKLPPTSSRDIPEKTSKVKVSSLEYFVIDKSEKTLAPHTIENTSKVLVCVGEYLESHHREQYTDVLKQLNVLSIQETNIKKVFMSVAQEIFGGGNITWAKIVSLFAFAGSVAVDGVLFGSPIHVKHAKCWTAEFIEAELVEWIICEGGWGAMVDSLLNSSDSHSRQLLFTSVVVMLAVLVSSILLCY